MREQNKFLRIALFLGDIFIIYGALFLALAVRSKSLLSKFNYFSYGFLVLYIFWIAIIFVLDLYNLNFFKKPLDFFLNLTTFSVLAFLSGVAYFYFWPQPQITPKTILILNVIIFDILFVCWRYGFNLFLEAKGIKDKIVIIGGDAKLDEIMPQIRRNYEVLACTSDMEELKKAVLEKKTCSVLMAADLYSEKDLVKNIFSNLPLTLNYIDFNDLYEFMTKKVCLERLDEAWFLQKISKTENKLEQIIKRLFDIILAIAGLLVFAIAFPFIALAIKIETKGPIFYKRERVGLGGKSFVFYKFGTMFGNDNKENDKNLWRIKDKSQITKVGGFLRKTHLDELPQAWNVLKGDMSFVGPRPEWVEIAKVFEKEIPFYKQRYLVKPGLFGWAQINFPASKSVNEAKEKFEYDLYYVKNRSLLLDTEIILKSVKLFLF